MVFSRALNFSRFNYLPFLLLFVLVSANGLYASTNKNTQIQVASTISGIVFDQNRNPVPRVDVELSNRRVGGSTFLRAKTDEVGRYEFTNLADGTYIVKVMPFRFNLKDKSAEVIIHNISLLGTGSGYYTQDFHLEYKKGGLGDTTTGVVFAQEVPKEAELLYKEAVDAINDEKATDGMNKLIKAIRVFPKYYAASLLLGTELLKTGNHLEAARLFIRAAEVNPKSSKAFYFMGYSLNKLGKKYNSGALKALEKAVILAPTSWKVFYLTGKVYREEGDYTKAEKHLLRAKKLVDTKNPQIHIELAQLYGNNLKQYGKAANELELYLKASKKKDAKIEKQIADLRNKAKSQS